MSGPETPKQNVDAPSKSSVPRATAEDIAKYGEKFHSKLGDIQAREALDRELSDEERLANKLVLSADSELRADQEEFQHLVKMRARATAEASIPNEVFMQNYMNLHSYLMNVDRKNQEIYKQLR